MKNRKNSVLLIIISVVLIMLLLFGGSLFLLSSMGYVEFKGNSSDKVDEEVDNVENNKEQEVVKEYKFGDEVVLPKLAEWEFYDTTVDYSKWRVLEESEEYIKLFSVSDQPWGKGGLSEKDSFIYLEKEFEQKGIDFGVMGNVSLLDENDLVLFGCDVDTLKCSGTPEWVKNSLTSVYSVNDDIVNVIVIDNDKDNVNGAELFSFEDGLALAPVWYTITILKSNLE